MKPYIQYRGLRFALFLLPALLFAPFGVSQDLIKAPDDAEMYRLSNLRIENDQFGRSVLAFDYKRMREKQKNYGFVSVGGKTARGPLNVPSRFPAEQSGTYRIVIHGAMGEKNFEIYLKTGLGLRKTYLISNVIRIGNPGPTTKARSLTKEEKAAIERSKLAATPPEGIPDGYIPVGAGTQLVPGMPVKAGRNAQWEDAEVINFQENGKVGVRFPGASRLTSRKREKWLAVLPSVLEQAASSPGSFGPSMRVLPGGVMAIPEGAAAIPEGMTLPAGTPLQLEYHRSQWRDVFVIDDKGDDIEIRYDRLGSNWDESKPRGQFVVTEETLAALKSPESVKKFAKNLEERPTSSRHDSGIRHKRYKINISIPRGSEVVPDDVPIEEGTRLAACWARDWLDVTVLKQNEDGSLRIRWDDYSEAWDCDMLREDLIIKKATLTKLKRKARFMARAEAAAAKEAAEAESVDLGKLKTEFRIWKDSSGLHEIEAVYVSHTESDVTLKSKADKKIVMPLDRLSPEDQELVQRIGEAAENPFEVFAE